MAKVKTERAKLSRDRIVEAALNAANETGMAALSMRQLAKSLNCGVMSLYNHIADKDDLTDAMIEKVAAGIELPANPLPPDQWQSALRDCAISAFTVLLKNRWACTLWVTREPGPIRQHYSEAILRVLRQSDFSEELSCRGFHAITMHVVGFALQIIEMPFNNKKELNAFGEQALTGMSEEEYPYLVEHIRHHLNTTDERNDFTYMLDLILDGLAHDRDHQASSSG